MASASAVEWTATVAMPSSLAARSTRSAISPRLAIRIFSNIGRLRLFDDDERLAVFDRLARPRPGCAVTVPARGAGIWFIVFIASMISSVWPSRDLLADLDERLAHRARRADRRCRPSARAPHSWPHRAPGAAARGGSGCRRRRLRQGRHGCRRGRGKACGSGHWRETRILRSPCSTSISVRLVSFRMPARSRISSWSIPFFLIDIWFRNPLLSAVRCRAASALQRQRIAERAEAADHADRHRRYHRNVAKCFARMDVGQMHLDHRHRRGGADGVVDGDRGVGVGAGIEDDAGGLVGRPPGASRPARPRDWTGGSRCRGRAPRRLRRQSCSDVGERLARHRCPGSRLPSMLRLGPLRTKTGFKSDDLRGRGTMPARRHLYNRHSVTAKRAQAASFAVHSGAAATPGALVSRWRRRAPWPRRSSAASTSWPSAPNTTSLPTT